MIKFENTEVFNFEGAFRGMRNPLNSWEKSDSIICNLDKDDLCHGIGCKYYGDEYGNFCMGENDLKLAQNLIKAGSDHRKFMRQIVVSVDIIAPLYWWKEFDTYKVATVANSCSTMHKIHSKPIEMSDFSFDVEPVEGLDTTRFFESTVKTCEDLRLAYLLYMERAEEVKNTEESAKLRRVARAYWETLIKLLPESYNQMRTVTLNYETLRNMYFARKGHKLREWSVGFMNWIKSLPYADELIKYQ